MDPFTMAGLLLDDVQLTPDQLAQLRALNTKYFTALLALQEKAEGAAGARAVPAQQSTARPEPTPAEMFALHAGLAADIRAMLTAEQQAVLDRNLPRVIGH